MHPGTAWVPRRTAPAVRSAAVDQLSGPGDAGRFLQYAHARAAVNQRTHVEVLQRSGRRARRYRMRMRRHESRAAAGQPHFFFAVALKLTDAVPTVLAVIF